MTHNLETLVVDLGNRSYPIHIGSGLLTNTESLLKNHIRGGRIAIITDKTVADLHLQALVRNLGGENVETIILPPGEGTKSFSVLQDVLDTLLTANFSRDDTLIAFGGGVIGDLTGFVASVLKRGCQFIQIPTTLLAQVDSSVGGKTAINTPVGKNLVGCFYQPKCVLIDTDVLTTLNSREMRAGYAEILKYALINDPEFFGWLEKNAQALLAKDPGALRKAVLASCTAKADIVRRDEHERGERALLNLGHSFAHALEAKAGYDGSLLHGEAVSAGMLMAFEYAQELGLCPGQDVERLRQHLKTNNMPTVSDLTAQITNDPDDLFAFMGRDKKNTRDDMKLILTRGIGAAFIEPCADQISVLKYLKRACAQ
jgi:3-dehydroquinate synthase